MNLKMQYLFRCVTLLALLGVLLFGTGTAQSVQDAQALNNGLALTPPMGWNSWNNFGCNVSDTLIRQMADAMVSQGMLAAGYNYVNIDDCWQNTARTNGHVTATSNFPNGIKAIADYVHSKGLKLGIYSDHGTATCQGRAGSHGFETTDANDYASWGVDYLKYDNCNLPAGDNAQTDNTNMKNALAASGRAIVFSICDWSFQSWMPGLGNLWRTTGDISDSWASMSAIPNTNNATASSAAPGAWNDPDMLEVGRGGMTDTEYHTHFGWWAIMAAPLIAGNDIRSQSSATSAILEAPEIIAVDQDPAGHQGTRVWDGGNWQNIWLKVQQGTNRRAVFVLNGSSSTTNITVNWSQIGLPAGNATVRDLWSRTDLGTFSNSFAVNSIPAHGSRMLLIASTGGSGATSYEAEAGARSGAAVVASCSGCSGGSKVGYIGNGSANYLTSTVNVSAAGNKTLTIYYLVNGTRPLFVSVNGGSGTQLNLSGSSWTTPVSTTLTVSLNAGNNTIKFYNDSAYAPDLDRITIQ